MSWPGFFAGSMAWLFFLLVPLILFYFLKLRRPKKEISSLVLWRRVLQDHRVNSPFQRFRRNLLLWLQLLLLVLLILAAMQPFFQGDADTALRLPILLDCSASMAALDSARGRSRLEAMKERAGEHIEALRPGQKICLIAFSNTATRLTGFTDDRRALLEALDQVRVRDVESDPVDALRMAEALARTEPFEEVRLITDGNLPALIQFEMPFTLVYEQVPPAGPNLGITALNARRPGEEGWRVFLEIEATEGYAGSALVELEHEGKVIGRESVSMKRSRTREVEFAVHGNRAARLEVRLIPDTFDALVSDNTAFLTLTPQRPLHVFLAPGNRRVRDALPDPPAIQLWRKRENGAGELDLVITDRVKDAALPARTAFAMGWIPEDLKSLILTGPGEIEVVDWDRASGLLRHVNFMDVIIAEQIRYAPDVTEADLENRGYRVLVHGHLGPLMLEKCEEGKTTFHLLFHLDRSTFLYRLGFPILFQNLMRRAGQEAGLGETTGVSTGVLPGVRLEADGVYEITGPDGSVRKERSDPSGLVSGVPAVKVGEYTFRRGGEVRGRVGAALLSAAETRLEHRKEIRFKENLSVTAGAVTMATDRPFWYVLALLAFGVLLVEWWVYQRRPGGI